MAIDTRVRTPAVSARTTGTTAEAPAKPSVATEAPVQPGFSSESSFDAPAREKNKAAEGRKKQGGVEDTTIGRKTQGGIEDPTIGRNKGIEDPTIGRNKGIEDPTIGRNKGIEDPTIGRNKGVEDPTIGRTDGADDTNVDLAAIREALVGPSSDPAEVAAKKALFASLETPSFLTSAARKAGSVVNVLKEGIGRLTTAFQGVEAAQLSSVMSHLDEEGLKLLAAGIERDPNLLRQVDTKGQTLLSNLSRLAEQPLNAKLASDTSTKTILTGVIRDVVNPERVHQGTAPTCTVTSLQYELVNDEPAEYARIMADLCSPAGKSKMRGGGDLVVEAGDVSGSVREWRSASQTIFQTAAMEYANGRFSDFEPTTGLSTDSRTGEAYQGIKPSQLSSLLSKLFGVKYSTDNLKDEKEGAKVLETLRGFDSSGAENRPVILHIDQGPFNHAVTLERVADGQVQFRDPYGVLRSMPEALFAPLVMTVQRPLEPKVAA